MAKGNGRGFKHIPCLKCGETDTVKVSLDTMGFLCTSCDGEWTADDVRAVMDAWTKVLAWVELAPESK